MLVIDGGGAVGVTLVEAADALEAVVDDQEWPLPKMRELLFTC